mmetsp:Transcript_34446/g.77263  ORF Transcript_34446/g.77263 Transcript_34446/m.77263 type:complete len:257 (+) Transcript_34446:57-827(+)
MKRPSTCAKPATTQRLKDRRKEATWKYMLPRRPGACGAAFGAAVCGIAPAECSEDSAGAAAAELSAPLPRALHMLAKTSLDFLFASFCPATACLSSSFASRLSASSCSTRLQSAAHSLKLLSPYSAWARRKKAFRFCPLSRTRWQVVRASAKQRSFRKQAAAFNSQASFRLSAWLFAAPSNSKVPLWFSISVTAWYLRTAMANRWALKSFVPTSFRAAARSSFSSEDRLKTCFAAWKSSRTKVSTSSSASSPCSPS